MKLQTWISFEKVSTFENKDVSADILYHMLYINFKDISYIFLREPRRSRSLPRSRSLESLCLLRRRWLPSSLVDLGHGGAEELIPGATELAAVGFEDWGSSSVMS